MNSHEISPTKVGNPKAEATNGHGRSLCLRDLFLSLVYGLLFGSLAFLTGCLEGKQAVGTGGPIPVTDYDSYDDKELDFLDVPYLGTVFKQPFSVKSSVSKWQVVNVFSEDDLKTTFANQSGPLVIRALDTIRITDEHTLRYPVVLSADYSPLYPNAKFTFVAPGKLILNGRQQGLETCAAVGSFSPRNMLYVGLIGFIENPVLEILQDAQVTIDTDSATTATVTASQSLASFVTFSSGGYVAGTLVANGVRHIVLGDGDVTNLSGQVLAIGNGSSLKAHPSDASWCMRSNTLANYADGQGSIYDRNYWIERNRSRCESARWKEIIESIFACQSSQSHDSAGVQ